MDTSGPVDSQCLEPTALEPVVIGGNGAPGHASQSIRNRVPCKGVQHLDQQVGRCDMVLCPVNCNSHGAAGHVKKLCQKYNKPIKILQSASVSAISMALTSDDPVHGTRVSA